MKRTCRHRAGLSLVETVVSMLIVSIVFTAALNTLGSSRMSQQRIVDRMRGSYLAQELLSEIMTRAYEDPVHTPVFGLEPAQANAKRKDYNDVDDYHNWSASPPQDADGNALTDFTGWRRSVHVTYVDPDNKLLPTTTPTGLKRITVSVYMGSILVAEAVALKSKASD